MKKIYRKYEMVNDIETIKMDGDFKSKYSLIEWEEADNKNFICDTFKEEGVIYQVESECYLEYYYTDIIGDWTIGKIRFDSTLLPHVYRFLSSNKDDMLVRDYVISHLGGEYFFYQSEEQGTLLDEENGIDRFNDEDDTDLCDTHNIYQDNGKINLPF